MAKAKTKAKKRPVARISARPVTTRKTYPFATTPKGQSFEERDLAQWPRLRVSASRYNKKNGTNFLVRKDGDVLRCGEPE